MRSTRKKGDPASIPRGLKLCGAVRWLGNLSQTIPGLQPRGAGNNEPPLEILALTVVRDPFDIVMVYTRLVGKPSPLSIRRCKSRLWLKLVGV